MHKCFALMIIAEGFFLWRQAALGTATAAPVFATAALLAAAVCYFLPETSNTEMI